MPAVIVPITLADLTTAQVGGTGVFDTLMRAQKEHLEQEYKVGRIKGSDYATVYLGSLQSTLQTALQFTLEREKLNLDFQLQAQQIALAEKELELKAEQILLARSEQQIALAKLANVPKEGALLDAQTAQVIKQTALADEEILIKKQQVLVATAEVELAQAKLANIPKEGVLLDKQALDIAAKTALTAQQSTNLAAEALNIPKQGELIDAQKAVQTQQALNLISEELGIDARTALTTQQAANAATENTVLVATECKLRAEFDLMQENVLKAASEVALLNQKLLTEKAQTTALGVDEDSVIGRQKALYGAQTQGYARDAEQKAADLMFRSWATRRTTDEATVADATNKLADVYVGRAVDKLLSGVGA